MNNTNKWTVIINAILTAAVAGVLVYVNFFLF